MESGKRPVYGVFAGAGQTGWVSTLSCLAPEKLKVKVSLLRPPPGDE
jgi:hypothetical protein